MNYLGHRDVDSTVHITFTTNDGSGGRVEPNSAFEAADIRIFKDGNATQRSSESGYTMTSTFGSMIGVQHLDIDLSDNTDTGFYAKGSFYEVVLYPDETVDSQDVSKVIGTFDLGPQNVNVQEVSGDSDAADNMELDYDGTGYNKANSEIGTCAVNTDMVGTNGANTVVPPTVSQMNARTLPTADYLVEGDTLARVTLVDTCTENSDMVGTNGANTVVPPTVAQMNARTLVAADYLVEGDTLARVTLVDTCTENSDMVSAAPTVSQILNTAQSESYSTKGDAPTMYQSVLEILAELRSFAFTGTTQTVKQLDGTTTAYTNEIDDANDPTSKERLT